MVIRSGKLPLNALISIFGGREYPLELKVEHRLDLHFDDVPSPDHSDPFSVYHDILRRRADEEVGLKRQGPTEEDARSIVEFARAIRELDGFLLCQCNGGVSRSSAAALLCLAAWTEPGEEEYCMQRLLEVRACACPHLDLVRFGDALLGRRGRLLKCVEREG